MERVASGSLLRKNTPDALELVGITSDFVVNTGCGTSTSAGEPIDANPGQDCIMECKPELVRKPDNTRWHTKDKAFTFIIIPLVVVRSTNKHFINPGQETNW